MNALNLCRSKGRKVYGREKVCRRRKEGRKLFWVVEILLQTAVNIFFS